MTTFTHMLSRTNEHSNHLGTHIEDKHWRIVATFDTYVEEHWEQEYVVNNYRRNALHYETWICMRALGFIYVIKPWRRTYNTRGIDGCLTDSVALVVKEKEVELGFQPCRRYKEKR